MQENEAIRKALSIWATGGQFGDEGKGNVIGKLINLMLKRLRAHMVYELFDNNKKPILVLRYQGGSNAGHKVTVGTMVYALHQIPSGIVFPHTYNMIGKGVYLNPRATLKEITNPNDPKKPGLRELGVKVTPDNLGIAANAIVTLDWYVAADQADFNKADHTSTGRGIKETGADKYGRIGIRFIEFLDPVLFKDILVKKQMKKEISSDINIDTLVSSYAMEREMLKDFMTLEHEVLKNHGTYFKLWEGAQGFGLDIDDGPYPGTTSSHPAKSPYKSDLALLIFKLYTSNVGIGDRAFVTRFEDRELEREFGASSDEFGTTTGKPRPLGWFDAVLAKYAVDVINPDYLVGTCGDRMTAFSRSKNWQIY